MSSITTRTPRRMAERRSEFNQLTWGWNAAFSILMSLLSLLMLIPIALVIIISFSSEASIAKVGFSFFPVEWSLQAYQHLIKMGSQLVDSYLITIFYTVTGTVLSLGAMSMYAYVLAQRSFPLRRPLTWMLFFTMLFSGGLVPQYIVITRYLGIGDSIWVFLLPSLVNAYNVIILRTFIATTIPEALFEVARIDGAGHFTIFTRIVLPLFKAGLATIGLFSVVTRWNDWFTGMLYINKANLVPLQTMLQKMQNNIDFLKANSGVANTPDGIEMLRNLPDHNLRMACTVVIITPMLVTYPFFQRYFVHGLTLGSIKE